MLEDYGLHICSNIASLVEKRPLSPAGNSWQLSENSESIYSYGKGACPTSDDLFGRSIVVPVPSRLTIDQENELAGALRTALTHS